MTSSSQRKVLLTVDGSDQALDAVRYVKNTLSPHKTRVVLIHVLRKIDQAFYDMGINPMGRTRLANIAAWEAEQKKSARESLTHAHQILLDAGFPENAVQVDMHPCKVGVARDIHFESQAGYSAVVFGRTGLSKVKDILLGSVAMKLIHKVTEVPVWVVGGKPRPGKILVALDASSGAMKAVDHVREMICDADVAVTFLNVIRGMHSPEHPSEIICRPEDEKCLIEEVTRETSDVMDKAKMRLTSAGVDQSRITTKLIQGAPSRAAAIYQEAKEGGYGTIVVGRRGLSKVQQFFMGRVGDKVIQLAKEMAVWVVS